MLICDVVFPQNLSFLSYHAPDNIDISVGAIVEAPLKGKVKKGLVIKCYKSKDKKFNKLKNIIDKVKDAPLFPNVLIKLLDWGTDYYFSNHGTMLKIMFFKEMLHTSKNTKKRQKNILFYKKFCKEFSKIPLEEQVHIEQILNSYEKGVYKTFLWKTANAKIEKTVVINLAIKAKKAIILCPEVFEAKFLYTLLKNSLGDRVCLLHGRLSMSEKSLILNKIYNDRYDIVVGTTRAIFVPMNKVSLIIVTSEHSVIYKQQESPKYNARDVAVMRGYFENATVVLTSVTPSTESYYNTLKGKYILLESKTLKKLTKVKLLYKKEEKEIVPFLTKKVVTELKKQKNAMLIIHRLGYSMLKCQECGYLYTCLTCGRPMIWHKDIGLVCHSCGIHQDVPFECNRCKSYKIQAYGSGIERIISTLRQIITQKKVLLGTEVNLEENTKIIVSTLKSINKQNTTFDFIAFLNPDMFINMPYAKAAEHLLQEIFYLKELIKENGKLILQTDIPWHNLFEFIKKWDYMGFLKEELKIRKMVKLPPFVKFINLMLHIKENSCENEIMKKLKEIFKDIDIVGPVIDVSSLKGYSKCIKITLKDADKNIVKDKIKNIKSLKIYKKITLRIDVDPAFF